MNLEITTSGGAMTPKESHSKSPITNDKELTKPSKSPKIATKNVKSPIPKKDKSPREEGKSSFRGKKIKDKKNSKA